MELLASLPLKKDQFFHVIVEVRFLTRRISISAALSDRHLLMLSRKITKVSDLRYIGLKGLKLKGNTIDTILNNNEKDTGEAAYKILQEWYQHQKNKHKAYTKLLKALQKCDFDMIATELKNSVEKPASSSSSSSSSDDDES